MATTRRADELRASLLRELETVAQREGFDYVRRLRWLRGELENYLDRWLAFAAVESIPLKSLLNDDLFAMVGVAAEVLDQQLRASAAVLSSVTDSWIRFYASLMRVRAAKDRSVLAGLRDALVAVDTALRAAN